MAADLELDFLENSTPEQHDELTKKCFSPQEFAEGIAVLRSEKASSGPASSSGQLERRLDKADGVEYSLAELLAYYRGGGSDWEAYQDAHILRHWDNECLPTRLFEGKRTDADGVDYVWKDFREHYDSEGFSAAEIMDYWVQLPSQHPGGDGARLPDVPGGGLTPLGGGGGVTPLTGGGLTPLGGGGGLTPLGGGGGVTPLTGGGLTPPAVAPSTMGKKTRCSAKCLSLAAIPLALPRRLQTPAARTPEVPSKAKAAAKRVPVRPSGSVAASLPTGTSSVVLRPRSRSPRLVLTPRPARNIAKRWNRNSPSNDRSYEDDGRRGWRPLLQLPRDDGDACGSCRSLCRSALPQSHESHDGSDDGHCSTKDFYFMNF